MSPRIIEQTGYSVECQALHFAVRYGHLSVVTYLIEEANVDRNLPDNNGDTALHDAAWYGHLSVVRYLIEEANVDRNLPNISGGTALHCAASRGQLGVVTYLIEEANVDDRNLLNSFGYTALHCAAWNGHLPVVTYLIEEANVDGNLSIKYGATALSTTFSADKQLDCAKYLLACGLRLSDQMLKFLDTQELETYHQLLQEVRDEKSIPHVAGQSFISNAPTSQDDRSQENEFDIESNQP